jgi:hypothetical protein
MLVRGRLVSLGFVVLSAIVSGGSCTSGAEDQTPIPASPGGTQPPAGEATLSELEACDRLRDAEEKARRRLNCPELNRADCPGYVRPAGTGCWLYDEDSLGACEEMLGTYEFCSDFVQRPCVVTAVAVDPSHCPSFGAGGEGGQSGSGGEPSGVDGGRGGRGGRGEQGGGGGEDPSLGQAGLGGTSPQGGASGESGSAGATG